MMGTLGTRSGGLRKGQSPCELLWGLSGFLYRRCRGLRPCVESLPEPEDSSPVLTWILGYFWTLPRAVSPLLEWGHARALSSRAVAAVSRFPSRGSTDLWLSLEAFPRGFPTSLSHESRVVTPFQESPRCLSPFQGNLFSLHCLDFQAEDRLTPRWHVGQPCGKASWQSLEGMPQIP